MYNIGIIGCGFVGGALLANFQNIFRCHVWDIDPAKRTVDTFQSFVDSSEIIFVCVPTPSTPNGDCDTSIVESVIAEISNVDTSKIVVIKSTVTPGTTERLAEKHDMMIGFNPEFLTERNAVNDFRNQELIVIGADDPEVYQMLNNIYYTFVQSVGSDAHIKKLSTKEAELFKYLANCFLAMKVTFANEFKILCDKIGVNYSNLSDIAGLDKRLGRTHWQVPGPDGQMGFGGSCFPKDTSALMNYADSKESCMWLLSETCFINNQLRSNNY